MFGEPGVAYLQGGKFYNKLGLFVRDSELPDVPVHVSKAAEVRAARLATHKVALEKAAAMLGPFGRGDQQEKLMASAERENRMALAAEERNL
jgi:hypothetical protein